MGFSDLFKKKNKDTFDPLKDLVLSKLRVGYFVDYDMKTWEVTGYNKYDFVNFFKLFIKHQLSSCTIILNVSPR